MYVSFGRWLAGLDVADLERLLMARPEACAAPQPTTLGELTERLSLRRGVLTAVAGLSLPAFQVAEALAALGDGTARADLQALLGATEADLSTALSRLAESGLVWPDGDRLRLVEALRDWPVGSGYPLALGPSAASLLPALTAGDLRRVARGLGLAPGKRKSEVLEAVLTAIRDPEMVRGVVATAPEQTRALMEKIASDGAGEFYQSFFGLRDDDPLAWATSRGLLIHLYWQAPVMPAEVTLALRGPEWQAPFTPVMPPVPGGDAPVEAVEAESASAADRAVEQVTALGELCATRPLVRRKSGGIGVREVRRAAKAAGADDDAVRLWLEVACQAELLAWQDEELVPTARFDDWRAAGSGDRLVDLLRTWWKMPRLPLYADPEDGPPAPLDHRSEDPAAPGLRATVLAALDALPAGSGAARPEAIAGAVMWRRPLLFEDDEIAAPYLAAAWREAELLGALAHGSLSRLGRALVARDDQALTEAAGTLSASCTTALFQADMTAVVPGPPSAELTELLDTAAEREMRGAASVWRFTPASVGRALDAGHLPEELVGSLRKFATAELPQPLEYLIGDVARRHGELSVAPLASAVCCDQPALVAELLGHRRLKPLRLRKLAPTVLASAQPVEATLAALREAGYLPVAHDEAGLPVIERTPRRRATSGSTPTRPRPRQRTTDAPQHSPADLAARLRGTPLTTEDTEPRLHKLPSDLSMAERRMLLHAVDTGSPVRIDYVNADGNPSTRIIENVTLEGTVITAWCRLREDERVFSTTRIAAVTPA